MSDILAVFRLEHPALALTETVRLDQSAVVNPIRGEGTDPTADRYLFSVWSEDYSRFEAGLADDPTVAAYEQVIALDGEAFYAIRYTDHAILFSTEVARCNGVVLDMENDGTAWRFKVWLPDRAAARDLWTAATEAELDVELVRVNEHGSIIEANYGMTEAQRDAVLTALDLGYFDEPRGITLAELADELDISEPSASRLIRRGLKRLVTASIAETEDE